MSKPQAFAIPVFPHVKQFLVKEFGPEPHAMHTENYLGHTVSMMVEKLPYRQLNRPVVPTEKGSYLVTLPSSLKHYSLTPDKAREIGKALNKFFMQQMVLFIKGQIALSGNERAALRSFYKLYELNPSDYDLESARKVFRDYKDKVLKANQQHELLYGDKKDQLFSDFASSED